MKKYLNLILAFLFTLFFSSCNQLDYLFNPDKNTVTYYGIVKEMNFGLCVEIPTIGLCEIPQAEKVYSNFKDEANQENYHLEDGNLICISFIRPKNGLMITKSYPAKFSQSASNIAILEEYLNVEQTDNGFILTQNTPEELSDNTIEETVYFIDVGGYNGKAYKKLICSGTITQIDNNRISMLLSLENYPDKLVEFLSLYHQLEQTTQAPFV